MKIVLLRASYSVTLQHIYSPYLYFPYFTLLLLYILNCGDEFSYFEVFQTLVKRVKVHLNRSGIISTDEDPGLRIENSAIIKTRGVSIYKLLITSLIMPSSLLRIVNSLFQTCCNNMGKNSANTTC